MTYVPGSIEQIFEYLGLSAAYFGSLKEMAIII